MIWIFAFILFIFNPYAAAGKVGQYKIMQEF